jgi:hypothetical protein
MAIPSSAGLGNSAMDMEKTTVVRENSSATAPLRLAVVLDSCQAPAWIGYLLRKLAASGTVDLCLVVLGKSTKLAAGRSRPPFLNRLWTALDRWLHRSSTDALRLQDCGPLLSQGRWSPVVLGIDCFEALQSGDIASLNAANPDLLLHLGHARLPAAALECAQLGVWLLQESESAETPGGVGLWREIEEGSAVFAHGPQIVEHSPRGRRTMYRACGINSLLSLALNQNAACWDVAEFLAARLADPSGLWAEAGESCAVIDLPPAAAPRRLSNARKVGFALRWTKRILCHELQKRLFREQWSILLRPAQEGTEFIAGGQTRRIQPPRDRFYADPFLIEREGRTYLFFEDYRFATGKGLISCCEVKEGGNCGAVQEVLECDCHLSYPFLLEWQGEVYMIPESREHRTVELYRATDFPYAWEHEADLLRDVAATDSTLLQYQGRWWLFASGVREKSSPDCELFLYYADSPLGPWTPHPRNPVVSDPRHARPAGCLYLQDGMLIRPGQDSSSGYGSAIQLHRVEVLSETDYRETSLARITPSGIPGAIGTHTFNQSRKYQVIDARYRILRFPPIPFLSRRRADQGRDRAEMIADADGGSGKARSVSAGRYVREGGRGSR